jgi:hypothetical protein
VKQNARPCPILEWHINEEIRETRVFVRFGVGGFQNVCEFFVEKARRRIYIRVRVKFWQGSFEKRIEIRLHKIFPKTVTAETWHFPGPAAAFWTIIHVIPDQVVFPQIPSPHIGSIIPDSGRDIAVPVWTKRMGIFASSTEKSFDFAYGKGF